VDIVNNYSGSSLGGWSANSASNRSGSAGVLRRRKPDGWYYEGHEASTPGVPMATSGPCDLPRFC